MSRHARMNPDQIGNDPRTHVPGFGSPRFESGDGGPFPPARRLTDSRLNPHGQPWTIEDALAEERERDDRCPHGRHLEEYCDDCKADALADATDRATEEGKAIARGESC